MTLKQVFEGFSKAGLARAITAHENGELILDGSILGKSEDGG